MENGALALEHLEDELLDNDDTDHVAIIKMSPPSTSGFQVLPDLPLASQPPLARGGRVALGCGTQPFPPT